MSKYWVKTDEQVHGPYEPEVLKYLDGFTEETLVSFDDPKIEEIWIKALDFNEIHLLFHPEIKEKVAPKEAPNLQSPSSEPPSTPMIETSSVMEKQTLPSTEEQPIAPAEINPSPSNEILEKPPAAVQEEKAVPPVTDYDLLDVMQKVTEEVSKQKEDQKAPTEKKDLEIAPKEAVKTIEEQFGIAEPEQRDSFEFNINKKWIMIGAALLILIGAAFQYKKIWDWVSKIKAEKISEQPAAMKIIEEPKKELKVLKKEEAAPKKKAAEAKRAEEKKVSIPAKPKESSKQAQTPKQAVEKQSGPRSEEEWDKRSSPRNEEEWDELQKQKYLLPGVLAPNMQEEKRVKVSPKEGPAEETSVPQTGEPKESVPSKTMTKEEHKKKIKAEKTKKQMDDMEWISQTGW